MDMFFLLVSNVGVVAESLDTWSARAKQHRPSTQQKKPSDSPVGDVAELHAEQDRSSVRPLHALVRASSIPSVELRIRL